MSAVVYTVEKHRASGGVWGIQNTPCSGVKLHIPSSENLAPPLVPSKPTLLGHPLGTKAPAPLLPATGGRCGAPPPDTELGEQGPSPTQIARDGRRFLSQRQRNKQILNHQQGSQHKNQHKPFGKCTNSHDNVACFHPVILPLSHTSKNNPQWGGGWKPRVPGWMFIIYFHRCSVKILGRPKASCKYFKFNNGSQSACLYVFCNETDNLLGKQNKQAHVIISTTREAL